MDTYISVDDLGSPMGAKSLPGPEGRLRNLSRLLQRSNEDPSLLLAREFAGEARQFLARGQDSAAERSIAAAHLALRLGNHSVSGGAAAGAADSNGTDPSPLDPPAPPVRRFR